MATEQPMLHHLILENKEKLTISGVTDVDTFDEGKIVLFTEDDTLVVEGEDLHIQKLDVANGELAIDGNIYALQYTGNMADKGSKGFFKRIMK